jgi:hypothetical protein
MTQRQIINHKSDNLLVRKNVVENHLKIQKPKI